MDTTTSLLKEPVATWGGKWTTEKLDAFSKYVSAYLTIMSKQKQWKTILTNLQIHWLKTENKKTKASKHIWNGLSENSERRNRYGIKEICDRFK